MQTKTELGSFHVAGVSYRPECVIEQLNTGDKIRFVAEPTNVYDANAIRIEVPFGDPTLEQWELIGYVPRKNTGLYHIMRRLGVKLYLKLFVNKDANEQDMLLVKVEYEGQEQPFDTESVDVATI